MELDLVNPDRRYDPPAFEPVPDTGWLHLGAEVAPPLRAPFVRRDARRRALLDRLVDLAGGLRRRPDVRQVGVFRAVLIPPADRPQARSCRFDVAVLVETASRDAVDDVRRDPAFTAMHGALGEAAGRVHLTAARCARLLHPVDDAEDGLFLFNHFIPADGGPDTATAIALWEHLAAWYVAETGLTNSALLAPTEPSDFTLVNHARWDTGVPTLAVRQFRKKTFRSYVRANLHANRLIAMPVLYRLAR